MWVHFLHSWRVRRGIYVSFENICALPNRNKQIKIDRSPVPHIRFVWINFGEYETNKIVTPSPWVVTCQCNRCPENSLQIMLKHAHVYIRYIFGWQYKHPVAISC